MVVKGRQSPSPSAAGPGGRGVGVGVGLSTVVGLGTAVGGGGAVGDGGGRCDGGGGGSTVAPGPAGPTVRGAAVAPGAAGDGVATTCRTVNSSALVRVLLAYSSARYRPICSGPSWYQISELYHSTGGAAGGREPTSAISSP